MTNPAEPTAALPAPPWRKPREFGRLAVSIHVVRPPPDAGPSAPLMPGTSRGFALARPSLLVSVRTGQTLALGEASPLPGFGANDTLSRAHAALADFDWLRLDPTDVPTPGEFERLALGVTSAAARHAIEGVALELFARARFETPDALLAALAESMLAPLPGRLSKSSRVRPSAVLDPLTDDYEALLGRALDRGYRTLKLKCGRDVRAELAAIERLAEVLLERDVSAALRLDPNLALSESAALHLIDEAIRVGFRPRTLDGAATGLSLDWIEDPTPRPEEWRSLAARCLVAADEVLLEPTLRQRALSSGARVFVAKPMMLGGVTQVLALAARAREVGGVVSLSHAFDGPVALTLASRLARLLQPSGFAAGLGMHSGLAGWQAPSAEPPLPADLTWPEALDLALLPGGAE